MIEAGLTQSRRATKVGIEPDPAVLRVFVPSCESIFHDADAVQSGDIGDDQETVLEATVSGTGTVTFWWKTSTQVGDEAAFYIDGAYKTGRSGISGWNQVSQTITTAGTHTLRWKYMKDSSGSSGSDCIWVDYVQWSGTMPSLGSWSRIAYTYDPAGRRIEKKVDGITQVKYVYDGDHILAEYNSAGTLLRKYVHGPGVDQPICMIEASGTYAGTHYYHYDALGSVVAMTNSAGNVVELYEYSVYGQVAASDENHPNRFMFTGREFDKDTGLYYYRARYYNPEIGRFLQTDPIGYGDGLNWHRYCGNNPINAIDPGGLAIHPVATGNIVVTQAKYGFFDGTIGALFSYASLALTFTDAELKTITDGVFGTLWGAWSRLSTSFYWRAYVEFKDYNDTNGNLEIDADDWESHPPTTENDLWGKPYWMEVRGVWGKGSEIGHYLETAGYDSPERAFNAAVAVYEEFKCLGGDMDNLNCDQTLEGDPLRRTNHPFSRRRVTHIDPDTAEGYLPDPNESPAN